MTLLPPARYLPLPSHWRLEWGGPVTVDVDELRAVAFLEQLALQAAPLPPYDAAAVGAIGRRFGLAIDVAAALVGPAVAAVTVHVTLVDFLHLQNLLEQCKPLLYRATSQMVAQRVHAATRLYRRLAIAVHLGDLVRVVDLALETPAPKKHDNPGT